MPKKQRDPEIKELESLLTEEPLGEEDLDIAEQVRARGLEPHVVKEVHGTGRQARSASGPQPERLPSLEELERRHHHPRTGDESITEQERAIGRFESEAEPTQLEEDFGERGLHVRGGVHDSERYKPSILEPDHDVDE